MPYPENELFSILDILLLLIARAIVQLGSTFRGRACTSLSALLSNKFPVQHSLLT